MAVEEVPAALLLPVLVPVLARALWVHDVISSIRGTAEHHAGDACLLYYYYKIVIPVLLPLQPTGTGRSCAQMTLAGV